MTAVVVPQLSISMEEAKVSRWLVEDGEAGEARCRGEEAPGALVPHRTAHDEQLDARVAHVVGGVSDPF